MKSSVQKLILIVIGLLAFVSLASSVYWLQTRSNETLVNEDKETEAEQLPKFNTGRPVPPEAKEYFSEIYNFSVLYPKELQATTYNEPSGAVTVVFQDIDSVRGFQLFIVPYTEPQVTPERFKQDNPSGVQEELRNVKIDGATSAAFYSQNTALGETYEIWFIHNGYLYEATTLKPLEDWLNSIIQTWLFI